MLLENESFQIAVCVWKWLLCHNIHDIIQLVVETIPSWKWRSGFLSPKSCNGKICLISEKKSFLPIQSHKYWLKIGINWNFLTYREKQKRVSSISGMVIKVNIWIYIKNISLPVKCNKVITFKHYHWILVNVVVQIKAMFWEGQSCFLSII